MYITSSVQSKWYLSLLLYLLISELKPGLNSEPPILHGGKKTLPNRT